MSSFLWISCDNGSVVNASLEILKAALISMLIWHVEFERGVCMQKRSDKSCKMNHSLGESVVAFNQFLPPPLKSTQACLAPARSLARTLETAPRDVLAFLSIVVVVSPKRE